MAPAAASALGKIEMLPITTATVFFKDPVPAKYRGFGCLFPPSEGRAALGVLMNDFIFEGRARACSSETWILGGALRGQAASWTNEEILAMIRRERAECFGALPTAEVLDHRITRWPEALPHYTLELERLLPTLETELAARARNIFPIGNYLGEIGLAKILARASRLAAEVNERGHWHD